MLSSINTNDQHCEADLNIICRQKHVVVVLYTTPNNICKKSGKALNQKWLTFIEA
jgi:hypothetical protein